MRKSLLSGAAMAVALFYHMPLQAQETTPTQTASVQTSAPVTAETAPSQQTFGPQDDGQTSVALPYGVMYQVLRPGTGQLATSTGTLRLHYTLYFTNGKKIESSRDNELPDPLSMKFGQGDFVPGVEAAIEGMKVGEVRRMYIPAEQAYGAKGQGTVPPNTPLLFVMELVDVR